MQVKKSQVAALTISSPELDTITVYLKPVRKGAGSITINCFDKSWFSYWPAMGSRSIEEFFYDADNDYLIGCLSQIERFIVDNDKLIAMANEKGLPYWGEDNLIHDHHLMTGLFGDDFSEWYCLTPQKENPEYRYLSKIIDVVKSAFRSEELSEAKERGEPSEP